MANDDYYNLLGERIFVILCICTLCATIEYCGCPFKHFVINVKVRFLFQCLLLLSPKFSLFIRNNTYISQTSRKRKNDEQFRMKILLIENGPVNGRLHKEAIPE